LLIGAEAVVPVGNRADRRAFAGGPWLAHSTLGDRGGPFSFAAGRRLWAVARPLRAARCRRCARSSRSRGITSRRVECTISEFGDRAGKTTPEEIVMALETCQNSYGLSINIKTERLYPVSRMVSTITGLKVQRNKTIVGQNAFAHEPGIYQ
jgi:hypothetical protein